MIDVRTIFAPVNLLKILFGANKSEPQLNLEVLISLRISENKKPDQEKKVY